VTNAVRAIVIATAFVTIVSAQEPSSPAPAVSAAPGASIDIRRFRYGRTIPLGDPGLIAIPIDAAVLAHSGAARGSLSDVRIVDPEGRQIAYLVQSLDQPLSIDLSVESIPPPPDRNPRDPSTRSHYRVRLPYPNLPPWRLTLETSARVFSRRVRLGVDRDPDGAHRDRWFDEIASAAWVQATDADPRPLSLKGQTRDAVDLRLIVDEGDNAPLPIVSAHLTLPSLELRLFQPAGVPLQLVYGRDDLAPPSYDLALRSDAVLRQAAREVHPSAERTIGEQERTPLTSPWVFWVVIAAAVVTLVGVLAKLIVRQA
jgi:hypothetical protein